MYKRTIKVDNTMYVLIGQESDKVELEREAEKIYRNLKVGQTLEENGKKIWMEDVPVVDVTKHGSDMFIWDKTGNKVLTERITHTNEGILTRRVVKKFYKKYDSIMQDPWEVEINPIDLAIADPDGKCPEVDNG